MSFLFISDLHLQSDLQTTVNRFYTFLKELPSDVQAIYILGDLFEMWIGDDDLDEFALAVIAAIRQLVDRNIPVYFQHGNRDFFISEHFAMLTGCTLLPEEYVLMLHDKRILLMHGDTLCEKDIAYQKARKWLRSSVLQWLFLKLPLSIRRHIAKKLRSKSAHYTKQQLPETMDVVQNAVERVMKQHQATLLIHGHTHRDNIYSFNLDGEQVTRAVLPAWHEHASALLLENDGQLHWLKIF